MTYCKEYPLRCKEDDRLVLVKGQGELTSSASPIYTQTEASGRPSFLSPQRRRLTRFASPEELNKKVSRPDLETTRLFDIAKKNINEYSKNTKLGSKVIEHTPDEVINSHLSQGAYETAYKGKEATKKLLKEGAKLVPELGDFDIVHKGRFTNNNHTTYYNPKTKKVYIAFRGSDANFADPKANLESVLVGQGNRVKNATDWGVNLHTLAGKEHLTKRYKEAVETTKAVANFFGVPVEEVNLTGHSLGGGQSDYVAETLGAKSVSFNSARNPLSKRPVKKGAEITTHTTLFDPVGLPRNIHEKIVGVPDHIKKNIITSSLGEESGWVNQHNLKTQFIDPLHKLPSGEIKSVRADGLRNTAGMIGSQGEALGRQITGGLGGVILPYALTPEYATEKEKTYRLAENYAENAKMNIALSPALFKLNPAFALIDMPSMMTDVMSIDPMLPTGARDLIREKLGLAKREEKLEYHEPPKIINWINKKLDPITGRYSADHQLQHDIVQANNLGVSLETYLKYDETEGDYFSGYGSGSGALKYSVEEAVELGKSNVLKYPEEEAVQIAQKKYML